MAMGQQDLFPLWDGSVEMAQNLMLPLGENLAALGRWPRGAMQDATAISSPDTPSDWNIYIYVCIYILYI